MLCCVLRIVEKQLTKSAQCPGDFYALCWSHHNLHLLTLFLVFDALWSRCELKYQKAEQIGKWLSGKPGERLCDDIPGVVSL